MMTRLFRNLMLVLCVFSLLAITCSLAVGEAFSSRDWEQLLFLSEFQSQESHLKQADVNHRLVLSADPFEKFNIQNRIVFIRRSPDGQRYAGYNRGKPEAIYITDGETLEIVRDTQLETVIGMAWSPDNKTLAVVDGKSVDSPGIYTIRAQEVRELTTFPFRFGAGQIAWSPDGNEIALIAGMRLYLIDAQTGEQRLLTTGGPFSSAYPAWSPDGSRIIYHINGTNQRLEMIDAATSEIETINTDVSGHVYHLEWSQDGNSVGFWIDVDDNSGDFLFYEVDLRDHSIRHLYTLPEALSAYIMDWVR